MMIHEADVETFKWVEKLANMLAESIGETLNVVEPKRRPLSSGAEGLCYVSEKRISIVLRFKDSADRGGKWHKYPLSPKEIAETVAHEVAHLVHENHSKDFRALEKVLVDRIPLYICLPKLNREYKKLFEK